MFYSEKIMGWQLGVTGSNPVLLLMPGVTFALSLFSFFINWTVQLDMSNGVPRPLELQPTRVPDRRSFTPQIVVSSCMARECPGLFYKGSGNMHATQEVCLQLCDPH